MDTVTESTMAIAMAQIGGLGVIHQFMTIPEQIAEILKVKSHSGFIVENPISIFDTPTNLRDIQKVMKGYCVSSVLVKNRTEQLVGIITKRDVQFETDENKLATNLMTPIDSMITAYPETTINEAREIIRIHKIEKLPLIDSDKKVHGLITAADIRRTLEFPKATRDSKGRLAVAAAIGIKTDDAVDRADYLVHAGADLLVVDAAHGDSDMMVDTIMLLKKHFPNIDVLAGNVATPWGVHKLIEAGVDGIKVGVGPSGVCTTRTITGAGVPQLTAIMNCSKKASEKDVPICADGGIKDSGDIIKALAAGANTVMIGNLLAGTEETPGKVFLRNGQRYKRYRGSASIDANLERREREYREIDPDYDGYVPEGIDQWVPYKGPMKTIIEQLLGGVRSGITYCGSDNIKDMQSNAEFIMVRK